MVLKQVAATLYKLGADYEFQNYPTEWAPENYLGLLSKIKYYQLEIIKNYVTNIPLVMPSLKNIRWEM